MFITVSHFYFYAVNNLLYIFNYIVIQFIIYF